MGLSANVLNLSQLNGVIYASQQPGSDPGAKLNAAIAIAVAQGGGSVIGDFYESVILTTTVNIPTGVSVQLYRCYYTCNITPAFIVADGARLSGFGSDTNNANTTLWLGNGVNGDLVQLIATGGTSNTWHSGCLEDLAIGGNNTNNTAGNGIQLWNLGEASTIQRVVVYDCAGSGILFNGGMTGTHTLQSIFSGLNNRYGFEFVNVSDFAKLHSVGGDGNKLGLFYAKPGSGVGAFSIAASHVKSENSHDPVFYLDGTNNVTTVSIDGLIAAGTATNFIKSTGYQPYIHAANIYIPGYTNVYNDTNVSYAVSVAQVSPHVGIIPLWTYASAVTGGVSASFGQMAVYGATATLANGANGNITLGPSSNKGDTNSFVRIVGPTGAFSIGGLGRNSWAPSDGTLLYLYSTVAQTLTINNEDLNSPATNRIRTLTGANCVCSANAPVCATFIYSGSDSRWILVNLSPSTLDSL